ncbi:MAG: hypothetical protein ACYTE0_04270 [Planctomycetota bacterium]
MMGKQTYDNFYHYNRNYGCRCREVVYKGHRTLILENEKLRLMIVVDKGTDIIELLYKPKDIDFMWQSPVDLPAPHNRSLNKELPTQTDGARHPWRGVSVAVGVSGRGR